VALEKASLTNTVSGERIPVQFNPEEYTVQRAVQYAQSAVPGLSAPILQFVAGNLQTLDMELFLDTYEAGSDVREVTRKVTDLMNIDGTTHAPPTLLFVWGSLSMTCVLARANQRFTMFLADGRPVRATLQVSFNELRNADLEAREIKRETADYSKTREVRDGETLAAIAHAEYGNPALWRPIALRNGIDRPRALTAGQRLIIPRLPYRDPQTGEVFP
jgi:nucleoid-associated protein YgaU